MNLKQVRDVAVPIIGGLLFFLVLLYACMATASYNITMDSRLSLVSDSGFGFGHRSNSLGAKPLGYRLDHSA